MLKKFAALLLVALTLAAAGCSPQAAQAQLPTEAPVTQPPATQVPPYGNACAHPYSQPHTRAYARACAYGHPLLLLCAHGKHDL